MVLAYEVLKQTGKNTFKVNFDHSRKDTNFWAKGLEEGQEDKEFLISSF